MSQKFSIGDRTWQLPLIGGILLLALSFFLGMGDTKRFWSGYLNAFTFTLSIMIGALFINMVMTMGRAHWHVALRRIPETLAWGFPFLFVLGLPIYFFGYHDLYHWTHKGLTDPNSPEFDAIIAGKSGYLNWTFWFIRYCVYFAIWSWLAYRMHMLSTTEDERPGTANEHIRPMTRLAMKMHMAGTGEEMHIDFPQLRRFTAAWGIPLGGLACTFAAFDLLMSLDPHWFSTIFGVYFYAGGFVNAAATVLLIAFLLQYKGYIQETITDEHFHDLGKMMFAFIVFWAYIGFSQFMLIWYANLPEETIFYRLRSENGWYTWSLILLFGHFVVPFLIMIGRFMKFRKHLMAIMVFYYLIMHFIDHFWLIHPTKGIAHDNASLNWLAVICTLAFIAIFAGLFLRKFRLHAMQPKNDVYYQKSLHYHNVS